jgi:hypothetical protein
VNHPIVLAVVVLVIDYENGSQKLRLSKSKSITRTTTTRTIREIYLRYPPTTCSGVTEPAAVTHTATA